MSDVSLAEISKGVWVPRGLSRRPAGGVMNPEDEEDECRCMLPGYKCGECREEEQGEAAGAKTVEIWRSLRGSVEWPRSGLPRQNAEAGEPAPALAPAPTGDDGYYSVHRAAARAAADALAAEEAEEERRSRPLEPVAAMTYEQARKMGDAARAAQAAATKAAKQDAAMEKAFKNNPDARESYSEAEWNEVPDTESPEPFLAAWYSCVKRYRFIQYGGPLAGGPKLIIEVVLMGDTLLRFILKLSQVKGVLTKSNVRDTHGYERIEEVIIDQRHPHSGYAPEQLKLKFAGAASALAFQMDLMSVL